MKRFWLIVALSFVFGSIFTGSALASTPVAIGKIILENQENMAQVEQAISRALSSQNLHVVASKDAKYVLNVYHKDTQHSRSFNWWILLLPFWPIMGITESQTIVYVDSQAVGTDGSIAWTGTGQAEASTIWFSDFRYPSEADLLPKAAERSIRGAAALTYEPRTNIMQLASIRF